MNGMVKCSFHGLRVLRFCLTEKEDVVWMNLFVLSGYILHNILIDLTGDFWKMFGSKSSVECYHKNDSGDQANEPDVNISTA